MSLGSVLGGIVSHRNRMQPIQEKVEFKTHRAYWAQLHLPDGFDVAITASVNSVIRRSRIGKITLKAAA